MNQQEVNGCFLIVSLKSGNGEAGLETKEVYVEGLPIDIDDLELKLALKKHKFAPTNVRILEASKKWGRRHAFITFSSITEAKRFIEYCKYGKFSDKRCANLVSYFNWPNIYDYIRRKEGLPVQGAV